MSRLSDLLQTALDRGGNTHTVEDIEAKASAGEMQIWPGQKSIAVTELQRTGDTLVCHVWYAAGDGAELEDIEKSAASWAKAQGCSALTEHGRPGWQRVLKRRGWRVKSVVMELEL